MFAVIGSTSTNTGFKLFQTIELAVAKNENGEVITSPLISLPCLIIGISFKEVL